MEPNNEDAGRKQINVRLFHEAVQMLVQLERYLGLSRTGVLETLVREKARALGLDDPVKLAEERRKRFQKPLVSGLPPTSAEMGPCEAAVFGTPAVE